MYKCKILNYFINLIYIQILILGFLKAQADIVFDEGFRKLEANAGPDINAPAFSTIMLDASRSVHSKGSLLRYEWLLPPSLVFYDDYSYTDTDTVKTHDEPDNDIETPERKSWKSISTKSKYIEIDLPEHPKGATFPVILKVKDPIGFVDTDTVMIIFTELRTRFKPDVLEPAVDSTIIDAGLKQDEELVDIGKPSFLISIQPLSIGELYLMESEMISTFLYHEIQNMDISQVLDPNRFIPDSVIIEELVRQTKIVADTIIDRRQPIIDSNSETIDTTIIEIIDTTITIDTLEYDQLVESTFYYNFYCRTDSCAAENAKIENATHVLTWGFNRFSELELHYFDVEKYLSNKPVNSWTVSPVSINPEAQKEIRYPMAIAIGDDELIITSANSQKIYKLNRDQELKRLGRDIILGKSLLYPSGAIVDSSGRVYVSDRDNNRVFSIEENMATKLLEPKLNPDGSLVNDQPLMPTSVKLGPNGNLYVLYEQNGTIIKVQSGNKVMVALKPGIVKGAVDIAVNSRDTIFVVSSEEHRVYRVENDSTVIVIAGTNPGDNLVRNNVSALQSYLGNPIAIDVDNQGNIYIADERFGLIRRIKNDGIITSLVGTTNKIKNMTQLRVSSEENPEIYVSQALEHTIQRITLEGIHPWSVDTTILHPKYIIEKDGIYGLEPELRAAIYAILSEKAPEQKITFIERSRELNLRFMAFIGRHPFLFAVLLLLLNQGLSSSLDGGASITDLPPDFPF